MGLAPPCCQDSQHPVASENSGAAFQLEKVSSRHDLQLCTEGRQPQLLPLQLHTSFVFLMRRAGDVSMGKRKHNQPNPNQSCLNISYSPSGEQPQVSFLLRFVSLAIEKALGKRKAVSCSAGDQIILVSSGMFPCRGACSRSPPAAHSSPGMRSAFLYVQVLIAAPS